MQVYGNTGKRKSKYEAAAEAGAVLALAAELNACPLGAVLFGGEIYFSSKPRLNRTQTMKFITELDRPPERKAPGSALPNAISGAEKLLRSHSLVLIFSDFRAAGWEKPLSSLAEKNEVITFRMTEPEDSALPKIGNAVFRDAESGMETELPSASPEFQKKFRDYNQTHQDKWESFCASHGIMPVIFDTSSSPVQVLAQAFRQNRNSAAGRII